MVGFHKQNSQRVRNPKVLLCSDHWFLMAPLAIICCPVGRRVVHATQSKLVTAVDNVTQLLEVRKSAVPGRGHDFAVDVAHSLVGEISWCC